MDDLEFLRFQHSLVIQLYVDNFDSTITDTVVACPDVYAAFIY